MVQEGSQEEERKLDSNRKFLRRRRRRSAKGKALTVGRAAAVAAIGAVSAYASIKGVLQGYQQWRRRSLRQLLLQVAPVLNELEGCSYWVDFGTLLGLHRDLDIILHDNDVDVVVLNPDWEQLRAFLVSKLPRGCRVVVVHPSEDASVTWLRVCTTVGVMDVYGGYYEPGDESVRLPMGHGDHCDVPASLVFPLAQHRFQGTAVGVPSDVPEVLRFRYGDTYMIPRYMDKGRDVVEQKKLYARVLSTLGVLGLRV